MMMRLIGILLLAVTGVTPGMAQETDTAPVSDHCAVKTAYLQTLESKYSAEQDALVRDGDDIGREAAGIDISGSVDVKMKDQSFIFDLPTVTMETKRMVLDLPQATMKTRRMSWDQPTGVMRRIKSGERPEVTCRGFKCTVRWKPMYMDIPAIEMRRKDISLDVPEFRVDRTEMKADIPKFAMHRQKWVLKIPQITLRNITAEASKLQRRGTDLQSRTETLAGRIQKDAVTGSGDVFQCYRESIAEQRATVATQYDNAIAQMDAGIGAVNGAGGDASKVQTDGVTVDLVQQRVALVAQRTEALAKIDLAIQELIAREKETAAQILI